jgi:large subunit ribosomal protein L24
MIPKSVSPKKQRRWRFKTSNLHERHRLLKATLSKDLRKKYGKRSLRIRKGDKVRIMRGNFTGHEGKVTDVDMKNLVIKVDGANVKKVDGTEVAVIIQPSNVMIIDIKVDDVRKKILER